MRKVLVALVSVGLAALVVAGRAGGDRTASRLAYGGLSVRVPRGWHVLRGWLSDVIDPAPRSAMASFPVRLSRHTCACGFPNVIAFPRAGAFVFVWEYLSFPRRQLARMPRRPAHFSLTGGQAVRMTCFGPSAQFAFKDAGHVFQVAVYLGPDAGAAVRAQTVAALDSLRANPPRPAAP